MSAVEIFKALGDPIRLEMIERLSFRRNHTLTSLSSGFGISRQGLRKHVHILEDAKLIQLRQCGRETTVTLDERTLEQGKKYIARLEERWEKRLRALKDFVEKS